MKFSFFTLIFLTSCVGYNEYEGSLTEPADLDPIINNSSCLQDCMDKCFSDKPEPKPDPKPEPKPEPDPCPEPDPKPEPDPEPDQPDGDVEQLLSVMNSYRRDANIGILKLDSKLSCAAKIHSNDIGARKRCTHTGSDGSSPWQRAERCGTSAYGEIVACGQRTAEAAVAAWDNSPGHKKIMLDPKFTKVGMAMKNNYWTAIFSY